MSAGRPMIGAARPSRRGLRDGGGGPNEAAPEVKSVGSACEGLRSNSDRPR